jgi:hypothetical protein
MEKYFKKDLMSTYSNNVFWKVLNEISKRNAKVRKFKYHVAEKLIPVIDM